MRESILLASIRSFFVTLFGAAGILIGFFVVAAMFGAFSITQEGTPELTYKYTPSVSPNASGIRKVEASTAPVILKLNIDGVIGLDSLKRQKVAEILTESRERSFEKDRVKAILLYIDSPGGTVTDADGIYREIKAYKEQYKVPVYAYVDGLCASGGYYIAAAADKIYASNSSLIGSVGVLMPSTMNFSNLMEKIGVQSITLYDGKGKDNLNPFRPWKKGEEDNIQAAINYYYQLFVDIATADRPSLDKNKLVNDYGANVFPAPKAKELGYIDESNATLNTTLKQLAQKIGIEDDYYQVVEMESTSWVSELFKSELGGLKGKITHHIVLTHEISSELSGQYLYLYKP